MDSESKLLKQRLDFLWVSFMSLICYHLYYQELPHPLQGETDENSLHEGQVPCLCLLKSYSFNWYSGAILHYWHSRSWAQTKHWPVSSCCTFIAWSSRNIRLGLHFCLLVLLLAVVRNAYHCPNASLLVWSWLVACLTKKVCASWCASWRMMAGVWWREDEDDEKMKKMLQNPLTKNH